MSRGANVPPWIWAPHFVVQGVPVQVAVCRAIVTATPREHFVVGPENVPSRGHLEKHIIMRIGLSSVVVAAQRAKQQFIFLTREISRFSGMHPFAIRPQCLARLQPRCFATLDFRMSRSARSVLFVILYTYGNGILGKLTKVLGAKAQQSLSVGIP